MCPMCTDSRLDRLICTCSLLCVRVNFFSFLAFGQQYITHIFIQSLEKSSTQHFHQIAIKLLKIIRDSNQVSIRQTVPVSYFFLCKFFLLWSKWDEWNVLLYSNAGGNLFLCHTMIQQKSNIAIFHQMNTIYWKHPSNFVRIQGHISSIVIKTFHFRLKCMFRAFNANQRRNKKSV